MLISDDPDDGPNDGIPAGKLQAGHVGGPVMLRSNERGERGAPAWEVIGLLESITHSHVSTTVVLVVGLGRIEMTLPAGTRVLPPWA